MAIFSRKKRRSLSDPHWQTWVPHTPGLYWQADREGHLAGPMQVVELDGKMCSTLALSGIGEWQGWWWSEPIAEPTDDPPDHWPGANRHRRPRL